MLRISKLADYGTVIMAYFAKHKQLFNAKEIAQKTHLSVPTVSKILKKLTQASLLVSERGVDGGYRLQRDPEFISIAEILYSIEESPGLTECCVHDGHCMFETVCGIKGNWGLISQAIQRALKTVSLADLASPKICTDNMFMPNRLGESSE